MLGGNKKLSYKKAVLKQLYFDAGISCAEISHRINRSIPLTTRILDELLNENLVMEGGPGSTGLGRKPKTYVLQENSFFVVSVVIDQFLTRIHLVSNQNKKVASAQFEWVPGSNEEALVLFSQRVEELIADSGIDKSIILGVGMAVSGAFDSTNALGLLYQGMSEKSIAQFISRQLQLPVFIDTISSLVALAEFRFGKANRHHNTMVLNLSWDIGLGMILNGEIFRGHKYYAGEFSHLPLFENNKLCTCGKTGCLETEASVLVLMEKIREGIQSGRNSILNNDFDPTDPERAFGLIVHAALHGDQFVIELIADAGYQIGRGVAILIHLLNPDLIVLSGRGAIIGKFWITSIQYAINRLCIPAIAEDVKMEISQMNYNAEIIGATALVMEKIDSTSFDQYPIKLIEPIPIHT
ncbi:MAG: ROK family transcriptional regulator [Flavihumibacter sp.]|jgi:predicted NBD/HSP70 family sugar kinase|nr:ROK family transcriptional regulator [Flavihumibacter sp.]